MSFKEFDLLSGAGSFRGGKGEEVGGGGEQERSRKSIVFDFWPITSSYCEFLIPVKPSSK